MLIQLFNDILTISIKCIPFIFILIIVTVLFQKKLNPQILEFIWILVFIKLVIPQALPFEISLIPTNQANDKIMLVESFSDYYVENKTKPLEIINFNDEKDAISNSLHPVTETVLSKNNFDYKNTLSIIWISILGILILYSIIKSYLFKLNMLNSNYEIIKANRKVPVIKSNKINYPIIYGCFKSRIYVPSELWKVLNNREKEHVLLHENQHFIRKDIFTGWLYFLVLCIHWFNPLVWLSFGVIQNLKEISCDRQVISKLNKKEQINYAKTLLKVGELCSSNYSNISVAGFAGKSPIKRRIEMIISTNNKKLRWGIMTTILIFMVGLMFLTDPFSFSYYQSKIIGKEEAFNRYTYKTNYRFKTDKKLIGTWLLVDNTNDINSFTNEDPDYIKYNGESYIVINDDGTTSFDSNWTKGLILDKYFSISLEYTIKEIGNKSYLFIEKYSKYEINKSFNPEYTVYIKYSNEQFNDDLYIPSEFNNLQSFDFPKGTIKNHMNVKEVISILGRPLMINEFKNTTDIDTIIENLPSILIMNYGPYMIEFFEGHLRKVYIKDDSIDYNGIRVGDTEDEVFSKINKPIDIIDNQISNYTDNVLYKNIGGREGYHYYHSPKENIEIYFIWHKVETIVTKF